MSLMYNYARSEDKPYAHNVRILIPSSAYRTFFFDKTSVSSAAAKNNHAKTVRKATLLREEKPHKISLFAVLASRYK